MSYQREFAKLLEKRLREPRRFMQVLVGPRRVGKTTAVHQVVDSLNTHAKIYTTDGVDGNNTAWIDQIWESLRTEMRVGNIGESLLIIDEIQKIKQWSEFVKKNWDHDTTNNINIKVVVLGSSRLLLQRGLSESLLGRYELIYAPHWTYDEILAINADITPEQFAWFGGYPEPINLIYDEKRFRNYIRNSIIEPTIEQDILELNQVNKPALLRQLFMLGISYSGQIVSLTKMLGQLQDAGNVTTLASYLQLLDQAGLLTGLENYSEKPLKTRASIPKFQVQNSALLTSQPAINFDTARIDTVYWGRVIESAIGVFLINFVKANNDFELYYWRERDCEIDFVLKYGHKVLGIEVKSSDGSINPSSAQEFTSKFRGSRVILVGSQGILWSDFVQYKENQMRELFR